jgi:poly-D-alanine transfer protein DltD
MKNKSTIFTRSKTVKTYKHTEYLWGLFAGEEVQRVDSYGYDLIIKADNEPKHIYLIGANGRPKKLK